MDAQQLEGKQAQEMEEARRQPATQPWECLCHCDYHRNHHIDGDDDHIHHIDGDDDHNRHIEEARHQAATNRHCDQQHHQHIHHIGDDHKSHGR